MDKIHFLVICFFGNNSSSKSGLWFFAKNMRKIVQEWIPLNVFSADHIWESHKSIGSSYRFSVRRVFLSEEEIALELARRRPDKSDMATPRNESDTPEILSGIFEGKQSEHPLLFWFAIPISTQKIIPHWKFFDRDMPMKCGVKIWTSWSSWRWSPIGKRNLSRVIGGAIAKLLPQTVTQTEILRTLFSWAIFMQSVLKRRNRKIHCSRSFGGKQMEELVRKTKRRRFTGRIGRNCCGKSTKTLRKPCVWKKIEAELAKALECWNNQKFRIRRRNIRCWSFGSEQNPKREGISGGITTGETIEFELPLNPSFHRKTARDEAIRRRNGADFCDWTTWPHYCSSFCPRCRKHGWRLFLQMLFLLHQNGLIFSFAQRDISPFFAVDFFRKLCERYFSSSSQQSPALWMEEVMSHVSTSTFMVRKYSSLSLFFFLFCEGKSRCCKLLFRAGIRHRNSCLIFYSA